MKKLVFLLTLIIPLILTTSVLAVPLSLPNPLGNVTTIEALILNISNYIVGLVTSLAVLMFVWAGILFLTSAGRPTQIEKAKKTTIYAVIGLAIATAGAGLIALVKTIIQGP